VTTQKAGAEGRLVPVYDSAKLKDAIFAAQYAWAAQQKGIDPQSFPSQKQFILSFTQTERQALFDLAMSYLTADKQSHYNPAAPVVVPTRTFAELGIPIATVLLPPKERTEVLVSAAKRAEPSVQSQDDAWDFSSTRCFHSTTRSWSSECRISSIV
jgi:hypothetical protein